MRLYQQQVATAGDAFFEESLYPPLEAENWRSREPRCGLLRPDRPRPLNPWLVLSNHLGLLAEISPLIPSF